MWLERPAGHDHANVKKLPSLYTKYRSDKIEVKIVTRLGQFTV